MPTHTPCARFCSTFDGYAIAYAVLARLAEDIGCRGLFATHYHHLTEEYAGHPAVAMYNMACHVDPERQDVTFLYKLEPGVCSRSYGMNVAAMAGVPSEVVEGAKRAAETFEASCQFASLKKSMGRKSILLLRRLIAAAREGRTEALPALVEAVRQAETL